MPLSAHIYIRPMLALLFNFASSSLSIACAYKPSSANIYTCFANPCCRACILEAGGMYISNKQINKSKVRPGGLQGTTQALPVPALLCMLSSFAFCMLFITCVQNSTLE